MSLTQCRMIRTNWFRHLKTDMIVRYLSLRFLDAVHLLNLVYLIGHVVVDVWDLDRENAEGLHLLNLDLIRTQDLDLVLDLGVGMIDAILTREVKDLILIGDIHIHGILTVPGFILTSNTKNTNQASAKSKAPVVSCSLIVPPVDQDDELKGDEKISYVEIICEVIKILPPNICPWKQEEKGPVKPFSCIDYHQNCGSEKTLFFLSFRWCFQQSITFSLRSEIPKLDGWLCLNWRIFLAPSKYCKTYGETLPTSSLPKLDSDVSRLDLSNPSAVTVSSKNLDAIEKQVRSLVAINSHADLFSSAAFQSLSSEAMDSVHLARFL